MRGNAPLPLGKGRNGTFSTSGFGQAPEPPGMGPQLR